MTYSDKLRHPEWFKLRRKIWERDKDTCQLCGDKESEMHVHHLSYEWGKDPWNYPLDNFKLLCKTCHWIIEDLKKFQDVLFVKKRIVQGRVTFIAFAITITDRTKVVTVYREIENYKLEYSITISVESIDLMSELSKTVFDV